MSNLLYLVRYSLGPSMWLQMALFHSFLRLCNIPLYVCTTLTLSIEGHLDCFHVLATVIKATMNIGVHVSFHIRVLSFLGIYPGVSLLER